MTHVAEILPHGKTSTYLFYIADIMGADVLATRAVRVSATMILTMLNRNNSVPASEALGLMTDLSFLFIILIQIPQKTGPIKAGMDKSSLINLMTWHRTGNKASPGPMMTRSINSPSRNSVLVTRSKLNTRYGRSSRFGRPMRSAHTGSLQNSLVH